VLVSIGAAGLVVHAERRRRLAEAAHEQLLVDRATELDMFAKRVAHDLLSPLSALSFTLGTLKRRVARGEAVDDLVQRADATILRARRLVDGALDFARSAAPQTGATADVHDVVTGVVEEARADQGERAEVIVEPFEDVSVECAPGVLASVLSNLVRNALKYMNDRAEQRVTIRVARRGDAVRVEVADTGPGLPPGLESRVFEPYVRAPGNPQPGLGLGLATVRRFVESHRGRVGVASTPGQGATFWFELPAARTMLEA
jgi:signal transduction histidine kinase